MEVCSGPDEPEHVIHHESLVGMTAIRAMEFIPLVAGIP